MAYLLQHLLSESAARSPDQDAVAFKHTVLSYRELDEQSSRLAWALQACGVERGARVGIYLHKSPGSVIGVFGILKAGAVYVPLDPGAPAKRLAFIANDCQIRVLVSAPDKRSGIDKLIDEGASVDTVVYTDARAAEPLPGITTIEWNRVLKGPMAQPVDTIETDLAYILYTSGSTGTPKGVMIAHRTIFTFIDWASQTFAINFTDRITSHAPLHFDLSTFDLYVSVKAGATIVLVPETLSMFPVRFAELLAKQRITVTYLVPSILSMLVSRGELDTHDLSALRLVLFAGEVFPIKYLRQLVAAIPRPDYYNLYGPTETNVCTYYKVRAEDLAPEGNDPVPIGTACENMEVFAVDDDGRRIDRPGQKGELWARGSCVAQGYWGNPERTAQNFVANVHQPNFAETAYRTGDLVYLSDDGRNWIYCGRRDHMIKSRGYRIEMGDIESALDNHPQVAKAAIAAIPDEEISNRIIAFVELLNGADPSDKSLQHFCAERLPKYMIPEKVLVVDQLPTTSSGKIDRVKLTESYLQRGETNNEHRNHHP